ncbi:Mitotic spindle assembly checkpoint protein MAD2B [Nymphon striatum]|nr:Mitotic spindle assembly checkpoint protein MAD2B [Nymphon striatum]
MGTDSSTESEIDLFCEFLETAFHTILSSRKIYSSEFFEPQMVYNVPITYCTHEEIMKYISSCLCLVKDLLLKQQANEIIFNIINSEKKPLERFVFNINEHSHVRISSDSESQYKKISDLHTEIDQLKSASADFTDVVVSSYIAELNTRDKWKQNLIFFNVAKSESDPGVSKEEDASLVLTSKDSFQELAENSETKSFPWKKADNYEALSSANQTSNGEIIPLKTTVLPSLKSDEVIPHWAAEAQTNSMLKPG